MYLDNDANLAGLAEAVVGEGKDCKIVQYFTVSTGLGAGLVPESLLPGSDLLPGVYKESH